METDDLDQLRKSYAGMSEDDLAAIAAVAYDLTDSAIRALRGEISRRRLNIQLKTAAPSPSKSEKDKLKEQPVVVTSVPSRDWAQKLQKILSFARIPSYLGRDNVEDLASFHGSFEHGVDIKVAVDDVPLARMLIENERASAWAKSKEKDKAEDDPGWDDTAQFVVRCPKCHSEGVIFDKRESEPGVETEFDQKYDWHCDDCGYQWQDEGIEEKL